MTYVVRAIEPNASAETLKRLWAANLPTRSADLDAKLRWFYRDGPHGTGRAFVVDSEAEPVGCAGLGIRTFCEREQSRHVALFADLAIDRRHRSAMPALALVRAVRAEVGRTFELGYGFPNAKAVAVYRRAGYRLLGEMPRYVRVLSCRPYLQPRLGGLARVVAPVVDGPLAALARVIALPATRDYELRWDDELAAPYDELWTEARRRLAFACERTRAFLRWRFKQHEPHRVATLYTLRTGELRGYAVLRPLSATTMRVADLLGADDRALDALVALLVRVLTVAGTAAVEVRFLGDPRIPRLLALYGFSRRPDTRAIMTVPGRSPRTDLHDPARWYLTDLDEDT